MFCDRASQDTGTGAAALATDDRSLKLRLGKQDHYTAYDGELTSFLLALGLARHAPTDTNFIWILNDSQTAIKDITNTPSPKSGQHIRSLIIKEICRLLDRRPGLTIALLWCAKGEVADHTKVDALAKAATQLPTASDLPVSYAALQSLIKKQEKAAMGAPEENSPTLRRLFNLYQPSETYKALSKLSRPNATIVTQLRSGHCPLNAYLHRFKAADTAQCNLCGQKETVEHFLLTCRKFIGLRRRLLKTAKHLKIPPTRQSLLSNPKIFQALADYGRGSFRSYKSRYPKTGPIPPLRAPPPPSIP